VQLLQSHDYNDASWRPVEVLPTLPSVSVPTFIQSGYFDFMVQVSYPHLPAIFSSQTSYLH
jgi:hypothetical protein